MTQFLPPNLLALFAPRDPLPYLPPVDKLPHEKKSQSYSGLAAFVNCFENPKDTPPPTRVETKDEKKERKRRERAEQVAYKLEQDLALWDPTNDSNIYGDPFKTLFIARINYDTSESKLKREFDVYGPVRRVHLVVNRLTAKPRGYAFVEFEHERDMHAAYKHADGKKIDGRRVLVDVERGRTVKGWRPRRLGGGLGNTRRGGPDVNSKYSGRDDNNRNDMLRERPPSPFERSMRRPERSRSRERRRRSRSRDRAGERRRRGASRERAAAPTEIKKEVLDEMPPEAAGAAADEGGGRKRERHRSRSRERSNRSRSRERKRGRRSRSRERRGSKSRDRRRGEPGAENGNVSVKQEMEDSGDYGGGAAGAGVGYPTGYHPPGQGQYPGHGAIDPSNY